MRKMKLAQFVTNAVHESSDDKKIRGIKENHLDTFVLGGGDNARRVIRALDKRNVPVAGCLVDDVYYQKGKECAGYEVRPLSSVMHHSSPVNLVIGFDNPARVRERVQDARLQQLGHVVLFDLPYKNNTLDRDFLLKHLSEFDQTYQMLADDLSRDVMLAYLERRTSSIQKEGLQDLAKYWVSEQYFNELSEGCALPLEHAVFVDCGAFDGDTAEAIHRKYADVERIYAFEPGRESFARLKRRQQEIPELYPLPLAAWSRRETLLFSGANGTDGHITLDQDEGVRVQADTIDHVLAGKPANFIKMDLEGGELPALKGAEGTIRSFMPMLAVCVYHKDSDLFAIPQYIRSLAEENPDADYAYYLRQHSYHSAEMVFYAVPRRKTK